MYKLYLFAALVLALTGCDTITKKRLTGTYQATSSEQKRLFSPPSKFELTGSKFVATIFLGEVALDYEVEGDYLYVNSAGNKYRFTILSPTTLRAEAHSPFEGTYVKVK